jgi:hypothetical protein
VLGGVRHRRRADRELVLEQRAQHLDAALRDGEVDKVAVLVLVPHFRARLEQRGHRRDLPRLGRAPRGDVEHAHKAGVVGHGVAARVERRRREQRLELLDVALLFFLFLRLLFVVLGDDGSCSSVQARLFVAA